MSVISLDRIGDQRIRQMDNVGQGEVEITFRARTNSPLDGQAVVLAAVNVSSNQGGGTLSIPPDWAPYGPPYVSSQEQAALAASLVGSNNTGKCLCLRKSARQTDNDQTWEVTCTFSASNPLAVPWKVTFHDESLKVGIDADINGNPIRNSFGDPFSNACEVESNLLRMHVVANFATYDPARDSIFVSTPESVNPNARITQGLSLAGIQNVGGPVNNATWWGFAAGTVRYRPGGTEWVNDLSESVAYFRREYDFVINAAGWTYQPLDCGFRGYDAQGRLQDPFQGNSGQRRSQPTLLDGNGNQLTVNNKGQYTAEPVYLQFTIYPKLDFSILGLGTTTPWP
jgi:hypothetical protein